MNDWKPLCSNTGVGYDRLLSQLKPKVAFDLGANIGSQVDHLLLAGVQCLHAFEPTPDVCGILREKFQNDPRVTVNQLGISNGKSIFLTGVLPTFAWALLPPGAGAVALDYVDKKPFDVQCIGLDEYIQQSGVVPDHLKVDVDGYECHVLEGGKNLFLNNRPWMLFEFSDLCRHMNRSADQLVRLIYDYRYQPVSLDLQYRCPDVETCLRLFPFNSSYDVLLLPEEMTL